MPSRCRRPFTIIEMLVVMLLIATIASTAGISMMSAIRKERFRAGVDAIVDGIQLSQEIMLGLSANTTMKISKTESSVFSYRLALDDPTKLSKIRGFVEKNIAVPGVKDIAFIDDNGMTTNSPIMLKFFSRGSLMTTGTLILIGPSGEKQYISLPGHPSTIVIDDKEKTTPDNNNYDYELYPREIFDNDAP